MAQCRAVGITIPIVPGIMPINSYESFVRMTESRILTCSVPPDVKAHLYKIKDDAAAVQEYGVVVVTEMCRKLIRGGVRALHFYTMNLEKNIRLLIENLQLERGTRELPWRVARIPGRTREDVRPIFWLKRTKSYLSRTAEWDGMYWNVLDLVMECSRMW